MKIHSFPLLSSNETISGIAPRQRDRPPRRVRPQVQRVPRHGLHGHRPGDRHQGRAIGPHPRKHQGLHAADAARARVPARQLGKDLEFLQPATVILPRLLKVA